MGFTIGNPNEDVRRNGHIYLEHEEVARICKALKISGVIPDFRSPNSIRLAPVSLYNTYVDVWKSVQILKRIMEEKQYKEFENKREIVA
jgi:kynureninase